MKNFLKNNWILLVLGVFFIVLGILFPDLKIEISGGFAWFLLFVSYLIGGLMIYIGIMGGSVSYESKGLVGWIKEIKNKRNKQEE